MLKRFLVIFPGALGDFICFLPALERLSGEGEVNLLARSDYSDLVPPGVRVRSLECHEISRLFAAESGREDGVARLLDSYAGVYSWLGSGDANFVRNLQTLTNAKLGVFPFRPAPSMMHMVEYYLSCLGAEDRGEAVPSVGLKSEAVSWVEQFWRQSGLEGKKVLALSPGSGAREKNWPVQSFQAVARWWEKERKGKLIVLFGPVEEERNEARDFSDDWVTIRNLELAKVAALLDRCGLYLGNDSGISHLAAALGVETFVLFGPTDPVQWAPRGRKVTVIRNAVECSPCTHSIMKACPHRKCLTQLPPEEVTGLLGNLPSFLSYSH
ncbi:MAG: glycosyltransferase family 9 protein [Candidatus Binatia bacterium]